MNNESSCKNEGNKAQSKKTKNVDNLNEEQDQDEYERIVSE